MHDRLPPVRRLRVLPLLWRRLPLVQSRTASGDSNGGENISLPGLRSSEPSEFVGNAWVCEYHAADHGVNARTVPPAWLRRSCKFLRIPQSTLTTTHPDSLAEYFLNIGNAVVRRKDTSRAGGIATCERLERGTGYQSLVTCLHAWRGACPWGP